MSAAERIARALGGAQREDRAWRCCCPMHGGHSLTIADGRGGRLLVKCWGNNCPPAEIFRELWRLRLTEASIGLSATTIERADAARSTAWARAIWEWARDARCSGVALVGMPSTGKTTPGMRSVIEATRTIEREAEPDWIGRCQEYAAKVAAAKLREEKWNSEVRAAVGKNGNPLWKPSEAEAPPPPAPFRLMAMDCTAEELQRLLADQLRGLLFMRNELAGWLGSHDKYGGNGADRAFFPEAWDGGVYIADRVKVHGKPIRIPRTSLAIFGGLQPELLRKLLTGDDDGLVARFIYLWPAPVPVADLSDDAGAAERRDELTAAARRLHKLQMDSDPSGTPVPTILRLAGPAFELFQRLRREAIEKARASRGMTAGWHGKTPIRALRLALVYECCIGRPMAVPAHRAPSALMRWSGSDGFSPTPARCSIA